MLVMQRSRSFVRWEARLMGFAKGEEEKKKQELIMRSLLVCGIPSRGKQCNVMKLKLELEFSCRRYVKLC